MPVLLFICCLLWLTPVPCPAAESSPRPPEPRFSRIVSLGPRLTEAVFLLGEGDHLVGNTLYCNRPEPARTRAKVGTILELGIEKILSLRPQLILATRLNPPEQLDKLTRLGLRVEIFDQPRSFDDLCGQFLRLGTLLGRESRAEEIVHRARTAVEAIRLAVAPLPRPPVLLQVGVDPLVGAERRSFTHTYIELAGGTNIAADQLNGAIGTEQVLVLNPEVILIAVMGGESGVAAGERRRWLDFQGLSAAKTGRVVILDPDPVCSPSPLSYAETLNRIARLIHPGAKLPEVRLQ